MKKLPFDKLFRIAGSCLRFEFFQLDKPQLATPPEGLDEFLEKFCSFPSPFLPALKREQMGGLGHEGFQFLAVNIACLGINLNQPLKDLAHRIAGCARVSWGDGALFLAWLMQTGALLNATTHKDSEGRIFLAKLLYQDADKRLRGFEVRDRVEKLLKLDKWERGICPAFPQLGMST